MIHPFPFLLVRTPLQSLGKVYDFAGKMEPVMEEGIYLSSSEFWSGFQKQREIKQEGKGETGTFICKILDTQLHAFDPIWNICRQRDRGDFG